jgi:hypothetical protein
MIMPIRYIIEAHPEESPGVRLYVTRRYRNKHGGTFSESLDSAMRWEVKKYALRRLEAERDRLPNVVHGHIDFYVIPVWEKDNPCPSTGTSA